MSAVQAIQKQEAHENWLSKHPVLIFFTLSYLISWLAALALHWVALDAGLADFSELNRMAETTFELNNIQASLAIPTWGVWFISRIVDFGPSIAGIIMIIMIEGQAGLGNLGKRLTQWRVHPLWYVLAIGIPAGLAFASVELFSWLESDLALEPSASISGAVLIFTQWLAIRFLMGGGLGEEIGWRGFALPRLQSQYGAIRASLIIGIVWTLWHLPAHLLSDSFAISLLAQFLLTMPFSIILTWVYNNTNQSILLVALMHAASNAFVGVGMESVYPVLNDEIGWILIYIVALNIVAGIVTYLLSRQPSTKQ